MPNPLEDLGQSSESTERSPAARASQEAQTALGERRVTVDRQSADAAVTQSGFTSADQLLAQSDRKGRDDPRQGEAQREAEGNSRGDAYARNQRGQIDEFQYKGAEHSHKIGYGPDGKVNHIETPEGHHLRKTRAGWTETDADGKSLSRNAQMTGDVTVDENGIHAANPGEQRALQKLLKLPSSTNEASASTEESAFAKKIGDKIKVVDGQGQITEDVMKDMINHLAELKRSGKDTQLQSSLQSLNQMLESKGAGATITDISLASKSGPEITVKQASGKTTTFSLNVFGQVEMTEKK